MLAQSLIDAAEVRRKAVSQRLSSDERGRLGQFFTPTAVAGFIASLIEIPHDECVRVLDPGAGTGSLSASIIARFIRERPGSQVIVSAFEIDKAITPHLRITLEECRQIGRQAGVSVDFEITEQDFIAWAVERLGSPGTRSFFDVCVMNPPYGKLNTGDPERKALESLGIRVTNLYPAFLALAAGLLRDGGQLSAITPRSFTNGPYFESFRRFFLARMRLDRLHVFEKRGSLFADTDVLQENVVIHATRAPRGETVTLSSSVDARLDGEVRREVPYSEVVHDNDPHAFVRIPVDADDTRIAEQIAELPSTLADLGIQVSTGRVVDFRCREHLFDHTVPGTVPLIYPGHIKGFGLSWPNGRGKKPNAFRDTGDTAPLLMPNETYVLVKRFTAKEERRRVVAAISCRDDIPGPRIAFENHLNVFHENGCGLNGDMARGLAAFLNSSLIDAYVRQFSGHTQINATDLRQLRYPSPAELTALGAAIRSGGWPESQDDVDSIVAEHVSTLHQQEVALHD